MSHAATGDFGVGPDGRPLPPPAFLRLHVQSNPMITLLQPRVLIDGYPMPVRNGDNVLPIVPGTHRLEVYAQWVWRYGHAERRLDLVAGRTVELWCAPPVLTFLRGALGETKQRHPGRAALLSALLVLVLAVVLLVVTLAN